MGPIEQLDEILPTLCDLVDRMETAQLGNPTPCDEFTVHDVIDHMITLGGTFAGLFQGESEAAGSVPPVYGRVPASEFRAVMEALRTAVASDGALGRTLDTPLGQMDGETFARVVAVDGLVHGWDLAVATGQAYPIGPDTVAAVATFAEAAISGELRATGMFGPVMAPPSDASAMERLAAFTGRTVGERWRTAGRALSVDKRTVPTKIDVPGAHARQLTAFGDASGYGAMAGEYFSLGAGTDIAPLLEGLADDACDAPHWGYMLAGEVVVRYVDGSETTSSEGELFYWPPGHTVRVTRDAEVVLFSPAHEHADVLDHMLAKMAPA